MRIEYISTVLQPRWVTDTPSRKLVDTPLAGMRSLMSAEMIRPTQDKSIQTTLLLASDSSLVLPRRQIAQATDPVSGPLAAGC